LSMYSCAGWAPGDSAALLTDLSIWVQQHLVLTN
jgi:hypothetical protein